MPAYYTPKPHLRSDDACRFAASLYEALQPWVADALGGQKRHRLESETARGILRPADSILADCAAALAQSTEWEGALLAHKLAARGWPVDVELVRACHSWSCGLMDRIMSTKRARRDTAAA